MRNKPTLVSRRRFALGLGAGASITALAGCADDDQPNGDDSEPEPEPEPEDGPDTFSIEGQVADLDTEEAIEGAVVSLNGDEQETDEEGSYSFDGIEEGEYTVSAEADGYEPEEESVTLPPDQGDFVLLSFSLQPED